MDNSAGKSQNSNGVCGWLSTSITPVAKCAMDGAQVLLWLVEERQGRKQIPCGDDNQKSKGNGRGDGNGNGNDKTCRSCGLHPTHRKVLDGWGTRAFVAVRGGRQKTEQRQRHSNDNSNDNGNDNSNSNDNDNSSNDNDTTTATAAAE
jgi:hypothetical protein